MKRTNLLYVLMSFLAFSILFGGIYFIIEEKEVILGGALLALSLISIIVIYILLKKQNRQEINPNFVEPDEIHYEKVETEDGVEEHYEETYIQPSPNNEEELEVIFDEEPQEELEEFILEEDPIIIEEEVTIIPLEEENGNFEFKVIVNDNYDKAIKSFITKMLDQDMFLESLEYRYEPQEIKNSNLEDQNIYKYDFHPIPMISLAKEPNHKDIIKVMIGMNTQEMHHVGYVPQTAVETVYENYQDIKNIKASLSGGTYRVLEKNSDIIRQYTNPFIIKLRIYL